MMGSDDNGRPSGVHFQMFSAGPELPVRWRLLSANNREMARGSIEYPTAEDCLTGIDELRLKVGDLEPFVRRTPAHQWQWELQQAGRRVVLAGHTFDRQIRCAQALQHFLDNVPEARVAEAVMVSDYRRWHSASAAARSLSIGTKRPGLTS
jgi:uncharacterized protein YegP (UPF0339 family)